MWWISLEITRYSTECSIPFEERTAASVDRPSGHLCVLLSSAGPPTSRPPLTHLSPPPWSLHRLPVPPRASTCSGATLADSRTLIGRPHLQHEVRAHGWRIPGIDNMDPHRPSRPSDPDSKPQRRAPADPATQQSMHPLWVSIVRVCFDSTTRMAPGMGIKAPVPRTRTGELGLRKFLRA